MKIKQMDISSANDIAGIMTYDIIDVWKVDISFCRDFILSRLALLNNNEKERYRNFYREEDKLCFAGGRIFTRILAGRYLDKKPEEIDIISENYMKPFIECAGRLKYNISHSGGCILLAFSNGCEIGVDIEKKDESFDALAHVNILHPVERAELLKNGKVDTFYNIWTAKEAYVKALGKGFSIPPSSFYIDKEGFAVSNNTVSKKYKVVRLDTADSFYGALCFELKI